MGSGRHHVSNRSRAPQPVSLGGWAMKLQIGTGRERSVRNTYIKPFLQPREYTRTRAHGEEEEVSAYHGLASVARSPDGVGSIMSGISSVSASCGREKTNVDLHTQLPGATAAY